MSKSIRILWFIVLSLIPVSAWAQWTSVYETGQQNSLGIGAHVSHFRINDAKMNINGITVDYEFDDVMGAGVQMMMLLNDFIGLELAIDSIMESDVHMKMNNQKVKVGKISTIPVTLTTRVYIPTDTIFKPYLGVGMGYYFNDFENTKNTGMSLDDAFGFHYCFGADLWLNGLENTALNFDLKYLKPDNENDSLDWDSLNIGIGFIYFFK
jgi:outer membrane protein